MLRFFFYIYNFRHTDKSSFKNVAFLLLLISSVGRHLTLTNQSCNWLQTQPLFKVIFNNKGCLMQIKVLNHSDHRPIIVLVRVARQVSDFPDEQLLVAVFPGVPTAAELFLLPHKNQSGSKKKSEVELEQVTLTIYVCVCVCVRMYVNAMTYVLFYFNRHLT